MEEVKVMTAEEHEQKLKELCKTLSERINGKTVYPKILKLAIQQLAFEQPETMGAIMMNETAWAMAEAMQDEVIKSVEAVKAEYERKHSELLEREKSNRRETISLFNERNQLETDKRVFQQKVEKFKEQVDIFKDAYDKVCEQFAAMETPEARDRYRAYMLFKTDNQGSIKTPQNNTVFLAVLGTLLSGVEIKSGAFPGFPNKQEADDSIKKARFIRGVR